MTKQNNTVDVKVKNLGKCKIPSPISMAKEYDNKRADYTNDDDDSVFLFVDKRNANGQLVEAAGPREFIYFNPSHVHAAIATCGGICPGLNNIIRSVVRCLWFGYGVRRISGIKFGYRGLLQNTTYSFVDLNPDLVDEIQEKGGSILGSARGGGNQVEEIVDTLEKQNINILFCIGGDGTLRGAQAIQEEIEKRGLKIGIVGIPKTIDNDLLYIQSSFGVDTAVQKATEAVRSAHTEAKNAINGIGLVKVMGREAGFIAAQTSLAQNDVKFCLIPENPFDLDGENGLLAHLEKRIINRGHAVVLVAEGAGQDLLPATGRKDLSGNVVFADIGLFLKQKIKEYFDLKKIETNVKYIDPSYIIRSSPADSYDAIFCARLGAHAVHAAMAGRTSICVALVHNNYVHLPISLVTSGKNSVDITGNLWRDVLENTRQPHSMKN